MFTCKTCPAGSDTHTNDYTNRLSCYPCDYDMCRGCVVDRWGPEALSITADDRTGFGFGRSAVVDRHRFVFVRAMGYESLDAGFTQSRIRILRWLHGCK